MELWTTVRVLVRRWYVVVPCLLVVIVTGVVVVGQAKPSYRAIGSLVALRESQPAPPADGEKAVPINPWQTADYSSNLFALLMAQAATDQAFQDGLRAAGASDTYTVTGSDDQSSTLHIEVTAASSDEALRSYGLVIDALRTDARRRQEASGAPEVTWISLVEVTVPIRADRQNGAKVVAFIVIAAVGLLGTLGLTFLVDAAASARAHARSGRTRSGEDPDDAPEPDGVLTIDDLIDLSEPHEHDDGVAVESIVGAPEPAHPNSSLGSLGSNGSNGSLGSALVPPGPVPGPSGTTVAAGRNSSS